MPEDVVGSGEGKEEENVMMKTSFIKVNQRRRKMDFAFDRSGNGQVFRRQIS